MEMEMEVEGIPALESLPALEKVGDDRLRKEKSVDRQPYPIARQTDPASSHTAAQEIERTGRRASQSEALLEMVKRHPRRTALELSRLSRVDRYTISRRLPELERRGLIRRGLIRDCTVNGRPMLTWEPVTEDPQQMKLLEEESK